KLTTEHVGDDTALPDLLTDVDEDVSRFLADGAYDGLGVVDCLENKFGAGRRCCRTLCARDSQR
ncbi:hypothetical protein AB1E33_29415, partial [Ruegeria sp. 2012CJ15-1]